MKFNFNKVHILNRAVKKANVNPVQRDSAKEGQIPTLNSPLIYAVSVRLCVLNVILLACL